MRKYEAMATEAARKFCTRSCVTGHDCGLEHRKLLPLLDSTSSCPLEKYHSREKGREEPEKRLTFEEMMKAQPKNSDFFYLCADCLNGIIEENKKSELEVRAADWNKCLDCPVQNAWEAMQEAQAAANYS